MELPDPIIDEIRRVRHEISREVGHDMRKLLPRLRELEAKFSGRIITKSSISHENSPICERSENRS